MKKKLANQASGSNNVGSVKDGGVLGRIVDAAWKQQPLLMKALSVVAVTLLILAYGAKAIRQMGAANILAALLLGGGIALVVGQLVAAWGQVRTGRSAPPWLMALRWLVAITFGVGSILVAVLLLENYGEQDGEKPLTSFLSRLMPRCTVGEDVQVVQVQEAAELARFQSPRAVRSCGYLKDLEGLRLASVDLKQGSEIWASFVEIPAGVTITLHEHDLSIHAVEIRGGGRIVGWPEEEVPSPPREDGKAGTKGGESGNLELDIFGHGSGSWAIDLRGQPGGPGSRGTKGLKGRKGDRGHNAVTGPFDCRRGGGDGGRGGTGFRGGKGGDGGPGGDGGTLILRNEPTRDLVLTSNIRSFELQGAPGGIAGRGGEGGEGGDGGDGGSGKGHCGGGHSGPRGERGAEGEPGSPGREGQPAQIKPGPSVSVIAGAT